MFEPTTTYTLIMPSFLNSSFYCGNIYFATNNRISPNQIFPHPSQKDSHSHFFKNLVQSVLCSLLTSQFVLFSTRLEHQLSRDQNGNGWEQYIVETPTSRPEPSSASGNTPIESALHVPHCCLSDILIVQHC